MLKELLRADNICKAFMGNQVLRDVSISLNAGECLALVVDLNLFGANSANMMKLMCAVIVAVTLAIPAARQYRQKSRLMKEVRRDA